ncbi:MAG TPA: hypothetical protein VG412_07510 [Acidimicrobiales bacterium]|nr:hypothetical protein [Acidimicrobiales bacterium]
MTERGKANQSPRGRHSPGAHSVSGFIPAALDAAGEEINPFRASSRPTSKSMTLVASVVATIAGWLEPVTSRLVYAFRVAAVASLGVVDLLRRRLGTALVIAGAVISLGIGVVLGGAGNSVSASLAGVQTSTHGTTAKDWGELRSALPSGTTGSSSGKSQAPNTPASAGSVVGGGANLLAGANTAGPLNGNTNTSSHSDSPPSLPAVTSGGGSPTTTKPSGTVSGSGTQPTTTSTTSSSSGGTTPTTHPPTTTTRPPTTTTTTPPTTTTTQAPPPTTTTTTQPCTPLNHLLNIC